MHKTDIFDFQYATNTTREMLDIFLKEKEVYNLSVETLRCYKYHINTFITFLEDKADNPAFKSCTQKTYNAFILYLKDRGTKDVTINTIARSLRAWIYWLADKNCITPFKVVMPKYQKTIPDTYSDEELYLLLKKPNRHCSEVEYETWVFVNLAIATGLRLSSMLNIQIRDIEFNQGILNVNHTKNRKALSLALNEELLIILRTYIRIFELDTEDYLFCTGAKTKLSPRTVEDFVRRYNKKRGVYKKKLIHAFRHTFARNHYLQNHDMYRLKELMGHSLISTTEHYLGTLGLDTSSRIEYNPQAQFSYKESNTSKRRKKL